MRRTSSNKNQHVNLFLAVALNTFLFSTQDGPQKNYSHYSFYLSVWTADRDHADTNARIYVQLYGNPSRRSKKVWFEQKEYKRGHTDIMPFHLSDPFSPIYQINIGHDNTGDNPGWFLNMASVYSVETGLEQFFPCYDWLAIDNDKQRIDQFLIENRDLRIQAAKNYSYTITVSTGDVLHAETDALVYVKLYDSNYETKGKVWFERRWFLRRASDSMTFHLSKEYGPVSKLVIGHDSSRSHPGWYIDMVKLYSSGADVTQYFPCLQWLSIVDGDKEIARNLTEWRFLRKTFAKRYYYTLHIITGVVKPDIDFLMFIVLYGKNGPMSSTIWLGLRTFLPFTKHTIYFDVQENIGPVMNARIGYLNNVEQFSLFMRDVLIYSKDSNIIKRFDLNAFIETTETFKTGVAYYAYAYLTDYWEYKQLVGQDCANGYIAIHPGICWIPSSDKVKTVG